jgi:hypothetical protein
MWKDLSPEERAEHEGQWPGFWSECSKFIKEETKRQAMGGEEKRGGGQKKQSPFAVERKQGTLYPYRLGSELRLGSRGGLQMKRKGRWVSVTFNKLPAHIKSKFQDADLQRLEGYQEEMRGFKSARAS